MTDERRWTIQLVSLERRVSKVKNKLKSQFRCHFQERYLSLARGGVVGWLDR